MTHLKQVHIHIRIENTMFMSHHSEVLIDAHFVTWSAERGFQLHALGKPVTCLVQPCYLVP